MIIYKQPIILKSLLPDWLQRVEWIGMAGNQYINSNIYGKRETEIDMKIYSDSSGSGYLWGVGSSNRILQTGNIIYYYSSTYSYTISGWEVTQMNDIKYKVYPNSSTYDLQTICNGTVTTHSFAPPDFTTDYPLHFGAQMYNGSIRSTNDNKRFGVITIKVDNQLKGNFIPCYRKSDGVIGMYDTVSGTFFTNQGTGTFTKGEDI